MTVGYTLGHYIMSRSYVYRMVLDGTHVAITDMNEKGREILFRSSQGMIETTELPVKPKMMSAISLAEFLIQNAKDGTERERLQNILDLCKASNKISLK